MSGRPPAATAVSRFPSHGPGFDDLLRRVRSAAGITQEELAARSGVSVRAISNLERGLPHRPRPETVRHLADALELDASERERFVGAARAHGRETNDRAPVPVAPVPLIGRDDVVSAARDRLTSPEVGLLTLVGPAGVGKTRLAIALAGEAEDAFPDGVCWVEVAPLMATSLVLPAVARGLGVRGANERGVAGAVAAHLRCRRLLLVLDNLEHLPGVAGVVEDLAAAGPGVTVLATSREPLRLRREHIWPVAPLALPEPDAGDDPDRLAGGGAVALFLRRAKAANPGWRFTRANAAAVAALCVRLDGLPLAIELAAARLGVVSPAVMLDRLAHHFPLAAWEAPDLPARHHTLQAAIGWSYDLLEPAEQALFRRLGVCVGGWTLGAAAAVAGDGVAGGRETERLSTRDRPSSLLPVPPSPHLPVSVLNALASLVDKSLIQTVPVDEDDGKADHRFGMLETIRAFAVDRLEESGEGDAVRARHAAHVLALAERAEPALTSGDQVASLDRLERESGNIGAALDWALGRGDATLACRIGGALGRFWMIRGHRVEGRRWLDAALANADTVVPSVRARALLGAGRLAREVGDLAGARERLEAALALHRAANDAPGIASLLGQLGVVAYDRGAFADAARLHGESLVLRRELGDAWGAASTTTNLGEVARQRGRNEDAAALHEESLALFRALGDPWGIALALANLALARHRLGQDAAAAALLAESLDVHRTCADRVAIAEIFEHLASVLLARRDAEPATRLLAAAAGLREEGDAPRPPSDRADLARTVAGARGALGDAAFERDWQTGRAAPLAQIVAEASQRAIGASSSAWTPAGPRGVAGRAGGLTQRELEVLRLVADGRSNRQIADALFVSRRTAAAHVAAILAKLGAGTRAAASAQAVRHGLV